MSCQCYVASIRIEVATSGIVQVETCGKLSDGSDTEKIFTKIKTTHLNSIEDWWDSTDYGTDIEADPLDCPAPTNDSNFVPGHDYGSPVPPYTEDEFSNPVTADELRDAAEGEASYGDWEDFGLGIFDYIGHEAALSARQVNESLIITAARSEVDRGYMDFITGFALCLKTKARFSLARAKLPVRVVYDVWNQTDNAPHLSDQEFTLNSGNPEHEVELPLVPEKYIVLKNFRLFFCPWHL